MREFILVVEIRVMHIYECVGSSIKFPESKIPNQRKIRYLASMYHQISNISRALVDNTIVDYSNIVGASPVGAAPNTSSLST